MDLSNLKIYKNEMFNNFCLLLLIYNFKSFILLHNNALGIFYLIFLQLLKILKFKIKMNLLNNIIF